MRRPEQALHLVDSSMRSPGRLNSRRRKRLGKPVKMIRNCCKIIQVNDATNIIIIHMIRQNLRSRDPRISYADISSSRRSAPTMMQRSSRQPAPGQPAVVQHQLVSANQHQQHEGGAAEFHPALLADQQQVAGSVPPTVQQQVQVPPPGPIDGHQQQVAASAPPAPHHVQVPPPGPIYGYRQQVAASAPPALHQVQAPPMRPINCNQQQVQALPPGPLDWNQQQVQAPPPGPIDWNQQQTTPTES
ncbi:unnamed protein product [Trichogramma brassicae]|uniref:Uncharacterized protein n=1 Tax=Trichogramma brassicae TaxID=86971 RepID=A0A6H5I7S2_9HYME|nr:unnamed protein product [Trichogramma brassicae]